MSGPSCFAAVSLVRAGIARTTIVVLAALVLAAGCKKAEEKPAPPPPQVTISKPVVHDVTEWSDYSAYLSSPQMSNVQARVSGLIESTPFKEGAIVHKGDVLFKIDPRPFQADLDSKVAAVSQAKSVVNQAQVHLTRYGRVVGTQAISKDDFDNAKAAYDEAAASLTAAEAGQENSRLNLDWTDVRAPIDGRVGRINVTVGNLVNGGSGQASLLTTIVSIDPMYCYVQAPETAALRYQKLALQEKHADVASAKIPCYLQLPDEAGFTHVGVIDFVDNQVDVNTGTVQIRGVYSNPTGLLTPGLFTLMRIPASERYSATLIPDAAVNTDQNERFLLVVGKEDKVERKSIKLGALFGTLRAITSGLAPNDRVIVNGLQSARPGTKVDAKPAPIDPKLIEALDKTNAEMATTQPGSETQPAAPASQASSEARP